jgi:hypothetical protein
MEHVYDQYDKAIKQEKKRGKNETLRRKKRRKGHRKNAQDN